MDELMNYDDAQHMVVQMGIEGFVEMLESKYPYKFFSCSTAWLENPQYICKLRGKYGDLVIGWQGIHD